jgi:hypothetical protein
MRFLVLFSVWIAEVWEQDLGIIIPYEELVFGNKLGSGAFGSVHVFFFFVLLMRECC